jgi:cobalamin biosynthesis Mg chelatase CobN
VLLGAAYAQAQAGGKMKLRVKLFGLMVGLVLALGLATVSGHAQPREEHVVPLKELHKDAAQPAQTRSANEAALKQFFSSDQAQKALRSANVDYQQVDKAVGQLGDEDLAKLAERSRQAQSDFAAGSISRQGWIIILVAVAALIIALAIVF